MDLDKTLEELIALAKLILRWGDEGAEANGGEMAEKFLALHDEIWKTGRLPAQWSQMTDRS